MDNLVGIKTKNFVLIASDMIVPASILCVKSDESKFSNIYDTVVLAHCGSFQQCCGLRNFFTESVKLQALDGQVPLCSQTTAFFVQNYIHSRLRQQPMESTFMIMDKDRSLYSVDQYGAISSSNYICMGYSRFFLYGLLDREYREDMTADEAIGLLQKCIDLMKNRFLLNYQRYMVKIFENDQLRSVELKPSVN